MRETYATEVIREKTAAPPFMIEGETLEFEAIHGMSPLMTIISVILTFVPPFVWGPALYLFMRYQNKHSGVWVTNKRLVNYVKLPFSKQFAVTSIPLGEIRRIRRVPLSTNGVLQLLDRVFGIDDIQVFVKDKSFVQCSVTDVKSPNKLIQYVESVKPNEPDMIQSRAASDRKGR